MSVTPIEVATTPRHAVIMRTHTPARGLAKSYLSSDNKKPPRRESPRISEGIVSTDARSLDELLFDNAAILKIDFANFAMHLSPEWRQIVFKQLDRLLAPSSWEDDSALIERAPFMTFLRFVVYAGPTRFPSLGVSPNGHILAAWSCPPQQIAVEFLPADKAAATFAIQTARSKEIIAWRGHVADLKDFIQRNGLSACIGI